MAMVVYPPRPLSILHDASPQVYCILYLSIFTLLSLSLVPELMWPLVDVCHDHHVCEALAFEVPWSMVTLGPSATLVTTCSRPLIHDRELSFTRSF